MQQVKVHGDLILAPPGLDAALTDTVCPVVQELQRREVMFEGLSLRLRNAFDTNGLLRRALDEAKKSLLETAKVYAPQVCLPSRTRSCCCHRHGHAA